MSTNTRNYVPAAQQHTVLYQTSNCYCTTYTVSDHFFSSKLHRTLSLTLCSIHTVYQQNLQYYCRTVTYSTVIRNTTVHSTVLRKTTAHYSTHHPKTNCTVHVKRTEHTRSPGSHCLQYSEQYCKILTGATRTLQEVRQELCTILLATTPYCTVHDSTVRTIFNNTTYYSTVSTVQYPLYTTVQHELFFTALLTTLPYVLHSTIPTVKYRYADIPFHLDLSLHLHPTVQHNTLDYTNAPLIINVYSTTVPVNHYLTTSINNNTLRLS